MKYTFNAACGCFLGNGREQNQDNFYFNKKHLPVPNSGMKSCLEYSGTTEAPELFAVFDGMGGEARGDEAAFLVSDIFRQEFKKLEEIVVSGKEFMYGTCEQANEAVNMFTKENLLGTSGTTVAALYVSQNEVVTCNVGDSKIFRIRDKKMTQISEDHTDEKILSAIGVKKKPVLLQYIGVPDTEMAIEPFVLKGDIQSEDVYVICSDGVTDCLSFNDIYEIVSSNSAEDAVRGMIAQVNNNNGLDNATVIVVRFI